MKTILITGSSGLIGSALTPLLQNKGYDVVFADINGVSPNQIVDVRNRQHLERVTQNVDGIVHLAAISRVVDAQLNPISCYRTNVDGLNNVFATAIESPKKPWVLFASSREVYGDQKVLPVKEDAPLKPLNVYANSKVTGEAIVNTAKFCGIKSSLVRFSNVYGSPEDHKTRVIPAFMRAALKGQELRVEGSSNTFDFVHIDDAARGIAIAIDAMITEKNSIPPIHFVSGQPTTLGELANLVVNQVGSGTAREYPPRNFDVSKFYGDPSRAKSVLGWQSMVSREDGIKRFTEKMRNHIFK